jgi:hypothetical protein
VELVGYHARPDIEQIPTGAMTTADIGQTMAYAEVEPGSRTALARARRPQ